MSFDALLSRFNGRTKVHLSDNEAAQRVADNDNLVGELVDVIEQIVASYEANDGYVGSAYVLNARVVLAKAQGAQQ